MIEITVRSMVNPTENEEIIINAMKRIFAFENVEKSELNSRGQYTLVATGSGPNVLHFLFNQVRRQKTVQAFHNHLNDSMNEVRNEVTFMLNKQILTQGYLSLCTEPEESPLGPIFVTIKAKKIADVVNYVFPETEKGQVIESSTRPQE